MDVFFLNEHLQNISCASINNNLIAAVKVECVTNGVKRLLEILTLKKSNHVGSDKLFSIVVDFYLDLEAFFLKISCIILLQKLSSITHFQST